MVDSSIPISPQPELPCTPYELSDILLRPGLKEYVNESMERYKPLFGNYFWVFPVFANKLDLSRRELLDNHDNFNRSAQAYHNEPDKKNDWSKLEDFSSTDKKLLLIRLEYSYTKYARCALQGFAFMCSVALVVQVLYFKLRAQKLLARALVSPSAKLFVIIAIGTGSIGALVAVTKMFLDKAKEATGPVANLSLHGRKVLELCEKAIKPSEKT